MPSIILNANKCQSSSREYNCRTNIEFSRPKSNSCPCFLYQTRSVYQILNGSGTIAYSVTLGAGLLCIYICRHQFQKIALAVVMVYITVSRLRPTLSSAVIFKVCDKV